MTNAVLMFSPTDEKTRYEQGENPKVILITCVQSVAAKSIVHKFLKRSQHGPSLKEYYRVYCELYVWLRSVKALILHANRKKKILENCQSP